MKKSVRLKEIDVGNTLSVGELKDAIQCLHDDTPVVLSVEEKITVLAFQTHQKVNLFYTENDETTRNKNSRMGCSCNQRRR
jgi:hypothetical protein